MIDIKIQNAYELFKNMATYKLDERDIRPGMIVLSPKGEGCIESFDRRTGRVELAIELDIRLTESFKIDDLVLLPASVKPSFMQELGEIGIHFSMLENRMKDFLGYIFNLKPHKRRIFLFKNLTYSKSADTINEILNQLFDKEHQINTEWKGYYTSIKKFATQRNNLFHGDFFNSGKNYSFYNPKNAKSMEIKSDETYDLESIIKFKNEIHTEYHKIFLYFDRICVEVKLKFETLE